MMNAADQSSSQFHKSRKHGYDNKECCGDDMTGPPMDGDGAPMY
jgi:hypothetical protein